MKKKETIDFSDIPELTKEDFKRMRRVTPEEHLQYCKMLENTFHRPFPPRLGRPPKDPAEKYRDIHFKIHPKAFQWAQSEAKRRGIGYQTVINEVLLKQAA